VKLAGQVEQVDERDAGEADDRDRARDALSQCTFQFGGQEHSFRRCRDPASIPLL
jgi:hypothetical protein